MIDKDTILSNWDLSTVPSPCYVLHETLLADNLRVISGYPLDEIISFSRETAFCSWASTVFMLISNSSATWA